MQASRAALSADTVSQLQSLERRYFTHTFDSDSDEARASRLEKLIYGESLDGDAEVRIKKLYATAGASNPAPSKSSQASAQSPGSNDDGDSTTAGRTDINAADAAGTEDNDDGPKASYPHVTALENTILGSTFPSEPLPKRITRMEVKCFGAASPSDDLSERTDALDQYAEMKLHKGVIAREAAASPGYDPRQASNIREGAVSGNGSVRGNSSNSSNSDDDDSDAPQSNYPRINVLEQNILGQTYGGQPLITRLGRMETKVFGSPSNSTDLSARTDMLEQYSQKTLHKKTRQQREQEETANANNSGSATGGGGGSSALPKVLGMVGNTLLGMTGMGIGRMAGVPVGMGMPNFGNGGMGMAGRSRQQAAQQQSQNEYHQGDPKPEDPAVHADSPPPTTARMLTKVGWCEVQVFGETFPEMHLTDRLGQLNRQLQFKPGRSNIELMDDINAMVKLVQSQKQPNRSLGAAHPGTN